MTLRGLSLWSWWLALAVVFGCIASVAQPAQAEEHVWEQPLDVPALIVAAAERYGVDPSRMLRVAWCESRFDPSALNRWDGGSAGVFQFQRRTWLWASRSAGVGGASPFEAWANVEAAAWLFSTPGGYRHWTCQ